MALVTTGGTIATSNSGPDPATATLGAQELLSGLPVDLRRAVIQIRSPMRTNSWDIGPAEMVRIRDEVDDALADPAIAGVVVTHGTDTLEETATLLDITIADDRPVVLTGAMRMSDHPSPDGPSNLRDAVRLALSPASRGLGTMVCFEGAAYAARWSRKRHSSSRSSFRGTCDPVARVKADGRVDRLVDRLDRWCTAPRSAADMLRPDQIPVLHVYSGMSASAARQVTGQPDVAGLVVNAFGAGNVPSGVVAALAGLIDQRVPVVVASRTLAGGSHPTYRGAGGGYSLAEIGARHAGALSAEKARIVMLAIGAGIRTPKGLSELDSALEYLGRLPEGESADECT